VVTGRSNPGDLPAGVDLLALVRRYEPVLCFTAGEQFFPMAVDDYLAQASLWAPDPAGREPATLLVDHRHLDAGRLAEAARARPGESLFLRYVPGGLSRRELRVWRRRPDRPKFTGVSRLAAVGLLGRFIDAGMRLSLTLRGRVPGGLAAAAQRQYAAGAPRYAYHAYVSTDGGYVVIQYWFLYAMNDWRSSFCGVNDHEGDWEQITVYLAPAGEPGSTRPGIDGLALAWIAFSSHDETGDDLRRRPDDPDLDWVDGTHPVCFAGAGSHSGAYLAGDYLVRVQPPALARVFAGARRIRSLLFPWTGHQPAWGVDIPYVDYRRGDGVRIGPGTDRPWTRSWSTPRPAGCGTTAGCGASTPPTRSGGNAHRPVRATSAPARSGHPGRTRSAGPAWTRCRRPRRMPPGWRRTGSANSRHTSTSWTAGSPTAGTGCARRPPGWRRCRPA
jgi:hypothetical protein